MDSFFTSFCSSTAFTCQYDKGENPTQEPPSNNEDFLTEYEACLKNWKDAQKIISSEIVFRLRDIKKLEVKKNEHHRNKDKAKKEKCIDEINLKN
ncbi:hypothetical protein [Klebsiella pneumoniae]|uniref:hypothetical protein n=1 Tax=Klebsiella pneumoniae TaxID=573 RepID=UPI001E49ECCA|nr:hypothetical protein [Klebsiella pneumoniae]